MKKNIILTDCEKDEVEEFVDGFSKVLGEPIEVFSCVCNRDHGSKLKNIKRYLCYIFYPISFVIHGKKYKYVIGWQQFYALFYAFFMGLFHLKRKNVIVCCNFTYISKGKTFIGKLYKKFMTYCVKNLDYIHVLSKNYAEQCAREFKISSKKFIIACFGIDDVYKSKKYSSVEYSNYSFAIGRSNRDYDFLIETWGKMPENELLIIASDTYEPKENLPENIIHRTDIKGENQYSYIANCKAMIIPIKDGTICSGDTVLLTAMSFERPVIVTIPSTLGEMYIDNNVDGILIEKDKDEFADKLTKLFYNKQILNNISAKARKKFLSNFSRYRMGQNLANHIIRNH